MKILSMPIFTGLHLLEGQESELFSQRLDKLIALCSDVPSTTPIHLELASMANKQFVKDILEKVVYSFEYLLSN